MKTFTTILFFVISLLQPSPLISCTCDVDWSFCETINDSYHIVEVEVLSIYEDFTQHEFMDIKILETLQNGIIKDTLTVSSNTMTCNEFLFFQFNTGDTLVVNFAQTFDDSFNLLPHPAIEFYTCHTNFLKLNQDEVNGFISPTLSSQNYDDFKNNITACNDLIASNKDLKLLENEITISPNPFSEHLKINLGTINPSEIVMDIFSNTGHLVFTKKDFQNSIFDLPLNNFPKGIYFIRIRNGNNFILKKVVKI